MKIMKDFSRALAYVRWPVLLLILTFDSFAAGCASCTGLDTSFLPQAKPRSSAYSHFAFEERQDGLACRNLNKPFLYVFVISKKPPPQTG